ncbi:cell wall hydrolase [Phenylobacterium sp.]|uniref:cell wall hydrolase n=1 Tax=Phenylobacterium sp. TaxID=1871053 RepID=UPI0011FCB17F|nr:cell wall hydrolase [Phenylobacterium sp.]THD64060.1 MAG: cell wall hydrolase [Phenylobacterium sp.]
MGSGIGLALGAGYMTAGMAQAISDHHRAERIARASGGGFSETMLQREMDRLDPAALRIARAHDVLAADFQSGDPPAAGAWPGRPGERAPIGRAASALDNARQLDCLTQAVYFEARGETPRGQAAVAQVVLNRVANPSFPKTVCGVVFQGAAAHGCQFSFACDGSMRHGLEAEAWDRARRVAERALSGVVVANIGAATHFHTIDVQPEWGPQMLRVAQVGLHVFYRFNPHAPLAPSVGRTENQAVFASLPMGLAANLRLATAVLEKASDVTVAAATGLAPPSAAPEAKAAASKGADASAVVKAPEPASSGQPAESDR